MITSANFLSKIQETLFGRQSFIPTFLAYFNYYYLKLERVDTKNMSALKSWKDISDLCLETRMKFSSNYHKTMLHVAGLLSINKKFQDISPGSYT